MGSGDVPEALVLLLETDWPLLGSLPGEKVVLNAAVAEHQEDCHQMWERTTLGTDRAMSGAEERKAQNEERGSSVEEEHWRVWGRRLTFDLSGGSS